MNPQQAITQLRKRGWTMIQIAREIGMARPNLYKVLDGQMPRYESAVALIEMAKRGRKPPKVSP